MLVALTGGYSAVQFCYPAELSVTLQKLLISAWETDFQSIIGNKGCNTLNKNLFLSGMHVWLMLKNI